MPSCERRIHSSRLGERQPARVPLQHSPAGAPYYMYLHIHFPRGVLGWESAQRWPTSQEAEGTGETTHGNDDKRRPTMPLAKIHVLEGQYDEARLARVSSAVQDGLVSTLGIPPDDFFQIIHVLPRSQFLHTPSFLGLNYSADLILLELTFISGRPKETRLGLLKALNDGLASAAGISPDDLFIVM